MTAAPGYRLDISCCFCGGSIEVDEASRTVRCPHCGSALRIAREGQTPKYRCEDRMPEREVRFLIEHHLKKAKEPLARGWHGLSQVFVPYWRVTGTALIIRECTGNEASGYESEADDSTHETLQAEVTLRNKEITFCADAQFPWGMESLGIRAQVATLIPLESDFSGSHHLAPVSVDASCAVQRFEKTIGSIATAVGPPGSRPTVHAFAAQTALIYFPLWVGWYVGTAGPRQVQFDPLARRVVSLSDTSVDLPPTQQAAETGSLVIVPHRCPNCGADLPDRPRAAAFCCHNCGRLFVENGRQYREHPLRSTGEPERDQRLFPFWLFELHHAVDMFAPLAEELRRLRFREHQFLMPAFEITNSTRLLRLVMHYNRSLPLPQFASIHAQPETLVDATVGPAQGADLVRPLILAATASKGYPLGETPSSPPLNFPDWELVWLPYTPERYFWQESLTGAAIERAAVRC